LQGFFASPLFQEAGELFQLARAFMGIKFTFAASGKDEMMKSAGPAFGKAAAPDQANGHRDNHDERNKAVAAGHAGRVQTKKNGQEKNGGSDAQKAAKEIFPGIFAGDEWIVAAQPPRYDDGQHGKDDVQKNDHENFSRTL
jgi:hypothetical protein